jgi:hypothetical protein
MRFSKSALAILGGVDRNVLLDEKLSGEDISYDLLFTYNTDVQVLEVNTVNNQLRLSSVDLFAVNDSITFGSGNQLHTITEINSADKKVTLDSLPKDISNLPCVSIPYDLSNADFEFKLTPRVAELEDGRQGVDIVSISTVDPTKTITGNVITSVPTFSLAKGQLRLFVPESAISASVTPIVEQPDYNTDTSVLLTGFYSVKLTAPDAVTPRRTIKQRIAIILRTDGVVV